MGDNTKLIEQIKVYNSNIRTAYPFLAVEEKKKADAVLKVFSSVYKLLLTKTGDANVKKSVEEWIAGVEEVVTDFMVSATINRQKTAVAA